MLNKEIVKEAKEFLKLADNLNVIFKEGNKEHAVTVTRNLNDVTVYYSELVTAFYGLTILKENIKKDTFEISENSKFEYNGSMFDCSRNEVLNIKTVKEVILTHALMGLNRFMLYTEDTYEMKDEPYFGYLRGRYTKDEIKEIVEYATELGVDVVPCIQTLGHLNSAIKWAPYSVLADTGFTLNVENEAIYPFIEKMIKTCREYYSSKYIHIGMDEAIDLGFTAFMNEHRLIDKKAYLLKHLNRVVEICQKYDFTPMMWIDMFFKVDSKFKGGEWYNFEGKFDDAIKESMPNVDLVYWNYYDDYTKRYDNNMKTALDTGKPVTFAGGLIRWVGMVPNITPSKVRNDAALKMAIKNKVKSVFCTTWGDSNAGAAALSYVPGLAQYCAFDYGNGSDKKTSKILKAVTGLTLDEWLKLETPNRLNDDLLPFENNSLFFMYQDVLLGLYDTRVKDEYEKKYAEKYLVLKKLAKKSSEYGYMFKTYASMCDLLATKVTLGKNLRAQYKAGDKAGMKETAAKIKVAVKKLDVFTKDYKAMWYKENKPFGYEIQDSRLGGLRQRMLSAIELIDAYLSGTVNKIEELEETILPYNTIKDEEAICVNQWHLIVSASNPL
ncbi:MAG: beta-N-acetylhexosaminidase [Bacilli bacterium]|nr:beta-N-acetylhexosaminidase [Bacilli bacterium]